MQQLIYDELVLWYPLLDPPEGHAEEAEVFAAAFDRATGGRAETLLELGAGAGHNACHLKQRFTCTLSDLSEAMLGLSRELNPECEHVAGDMRTLRLERTFDAVLVHDGVSYMTTEDDLRAAIATAFVHTRPGGAALFTPDCYRETFVESTQLISGDDGQRALRCMDWSWDPDPGDTSYRAEYTFLLRDGDQMRAVHDSHTVGLFPRDTWHRLLTEAGYQVEVIPRPIGDGESDEVFLCRRP
ncbi:MAG: class I SAM-dependent methyltransferase [Myxococcota bacterium]